MIGNNHLFVLHHPKDTELLKKKEEAKKQGKVFEEILPTFDQAQEEIAQNSGLINYGNIGDNKEGKKSPRKFSFFKLLNQNIGCNDGYNFKFVNFIWQS